MRPQNAWCMLSRRGRRSSTAEAGRRAGSRARCRPYHSSGRAGAKVDHGSRLLPCCGGGGAPSRGARAAAGRAAGPQTGWCGEEAADKNRLSLRPPLSSPRPERGEDGARPWSPMFPIRDTTRNVIPAGTNKNRWLSAFAPPSFVVTPAGTGRSGEPGSPCGVASMARGPGSGAYWIHTSPGRPSPPFSV